MNASLRLRIAPAGLRPAFLFGLIGAVLTGFMVANAVTTTNLGTTSISLDRETFSDDPDVFVTAQRIFKAVNPDAGSPIGDTPTGIEATTALPLLRNTIVKKEWVFEFELKEIAVDSFSSGENFKVEVYVDDGASTSLIATLYMKQEDLVDDGAVEGVLVKASSGLTDIVGDVFSILISRQ